MELGQIGTFTVLRETQLGYTLFDGKEEIFLHHNECNGKKLIDNQKIDAFLYLDKKNRVAATLFNPIITVDKPGFVEVVNTIISTGVFVNIGISKDILISKDELPIDISLWPKIGDKLLCQLKIKGERLIAKILSKNDIMEISSNNELLLNIKVKGYVYRVIKEGINIVTEDYDIIFVHFTNLRKSYRLGEEVEVKLIKKNETDYTGSFIENKEFMLEEDAKIILEYLQKHNGVMAISDKTDSEVINKVFKMSKSSFKRALGYLYKQKLVQLEENKTILL